MSYETLDAIADVYIPLLFIFLVVSLGYKFYTLWPSSYAPLNQILYLFSLLLLSYGLKFLDHALQLWLALGLDYSTHTAVALSLVMALCGTFPAKWPWFLVSFLAYAGLMLYQQYHSVMDIVSTAIIIAAGAAVIYKVIVNNRVDKTAF